jgi:hypothetical protein
MEVGGSGRRVDDVEREQELAGGGGEGGSERKGTSGKRSREMQRKRIVAEEGRRKKVRTSKKKEKEASRSTKKGAKKQKKRAREEEDIETENSPSSRNEKGKEKIVDDDKGDEVEEGYIAERDYLHARSGVQNHYNNDDTTGDIPLSEEVMLDLFLRVGIESLFACGSVCRRWSRLARDPFLCVRYASRLALLLFSFS